MFDKLNTFRLYNFKKYFLAYHVFRTFCSKCKIKKEKWKNIKRDIKVAKEIFLSLCARIVNNFNTYFDVKTLGLSGYPSSVLHIKRDIKVAKEILLSLLSLKIGFVSFIILNDVWCTYWMAFSIDLIISCSEDLR